MVLNPKTLAAMTAATALLAPIFPYEHQVHTTQQFAKPRAMLQENAFAPICMVHHVNLGHSGAALSPQSR